MSIWRALCVCLAQVLLYLLEKGAIIDLSDVNDRTCLHAAATTGNVVVLSCLLEHSNFTLVVRKRPLFDWLLHACSYSMAALLVHHVLCCFHIA